VSGRLFRENSGALDHGGYPSDRKRKHRNHRMSAMTSFGWRRCGHVYLPLQTCIDLVCISMAQPISNKVDAIDAFCLLNKEQLLNTSPFSTVMKLLIAITPAGSYRPM